MIDGRLKTFAFEETRSNVWHLDYARKGLLMKSFALLAAIALVGCANATAPSNPMSPEAIVQQSAAIAQRERQCMEHATSQTNDELARIESSHDTFAHDHIQAAKDDGKRELLWCKVEADQEQKQLSSRELAEYQTQGEEERQRSSLMMIMTTSRLH
ncbi:MAG TPA: hypothetical protein VN867_07095 [Candidatus Binataceae bacterium]|nr:hypothetical protein [Candidatus Binataceae bacterium]